MFSVPEMLDISYCQMKRRNHVMLHGTEQCRDNCPLVTKAHQPRSVMIEKANLAHLLPELSRKLVCDIDARDIARYQQKRVAGAASPKTVNLEIGTLRAILKRSGQWARLQPDVKMLATRDDIGRAISSVEESSLIQACGKSRSRSLVPFVTLAIETGARYGVIRTLQLSQRAIAALNFWATHFPERKPEHSFPRNATARLVTSSARRPTMLTLPSPSGASRKRGKLRS